jgi:hypothetical protein
VQMSHAKYTSLENVEDDGECVSVVERVSVLRGRVSSVSVAAFLGRLHGELRVRGKDPDTLQVRPRKMPRRPSMRSIGVFRRSGVVNTDN